jgi:hypothetical protein
MKHYINDQKQIFAFYPDQLHLVTDDMREISSQELDELLAELFTLTPEQLTQNRINELKSLLASTDFKVLPDYQQRSGKTDAEIGQVVADRKAWYDELKELTK